MTPHKWAKEIKAWADGAEIQYRIKPRVEGGEYSAWVTQKNPQWYTGDVSEYRIKPGQDVKDPSVEAFERGEPVPIKDVLINPEHPAYDGVKQLLEDLEPGKVALS